MKNALTPANALLMALPNLPDESVPVGPDETGNVEVRRWSPQAGEVPVLGFPSRDHVEVGVLGADRSQVVPVRDLDPGRVAEVGGQP